MGKEGLIIDHSPAKQPSFLMHRGKNIYNIDKIIYVLYIISISIWKNSRHISCTGWQLNFVSFASQ